MHLPLCQSPPRQPDFDVALLLALLVDISFRVLALAPRRPARETNPSGRPRAISLRARARESFNDVEADYMARIVDEVTGGQCLLFDSREAPEPRCFVVF